MTTHCHDGGCHAHLATTADHAATYAHGMAPNMTGNPDLDFALWFFGVCIALPAIAVTLMMALRDWRDAKELARAPRRTDPFRR